MTSSPGTLGCAKVAQIQPALKLNILSQERATESVVACVQDSIHTGYQTCRQTPTWLPASIPSHFN